MATTCLQGRITIPLPLGSIEFPWPVPLSMACMMLLGLTNSSRMYWICWSCFLIDVPSRTGVDFCNSKKKTADDLAKEALAPQFLLLGLFGGFGDSPPCPNLYRDDRGCTVQLSHMQQTTSLACLHNIARYMQFWTCCWCNDASDDLIFPKFGCTDTSLVSEFQL